MKVIDRSSPVPAYYQLKQLLKAQIQRGELRPGSKIPTEEVLCERYSLSRTPVRQALKELVVEELLTRTRGRGTFVAAPAPKPAEVTTLRVVISAEPWREPLVRAANLWNQNQSPQIKLEFTSLPLDALRAHLIKAVGRGEAPDISLIDSVWVAEFANRYYLRPPAEVDAAWGAKYEADFSPALLAANRHQDTLHGIPITANVSILWYRRDWLTAEGFAPPSTWDDLLVIGRHFRQQDVRTRYGLGKHPLVFVGGQRGGETVTYQLLPFLWSAGGDLIADNQVVLDSPHSHRALAFLTSLVQTEQIASPDVVTYAWDEAANIFAQGQAALAIGGTYEGSVIRSVAGWDEAQFQANVGFVPIPAPMGRQPTTLVGGMSYVIYRQSQASSLALKLLDLVGQLDGPRIAMPSAMAQAGNSFLAENGTVPKIARARPSIPDYARVSAQFQVLVEDCLTDKRVVEEAVPRTAEMIAAVTGLGVKNV